jgi:hypothetical protein
MSNNNTKPNIGRRLRLIVEHKVVMPALYCRKEAYRRLNDADGAGNLMVNIGGGYFLRRGWKSLDHHSSSYPYKASYLDYNFDLTSGEPFPFADNSVRFFYSQHALEHIPHEFCPHIFSEIHRCLAPGGAARLTMPDFDKAYDAYMTGNDQFFANYHGVGAGVLENALIGMFATGIVGKVSADEVRDMTDSMAKEEFADHCTGLVSRADHQTNRGNHINWWTYNKLERMLGYVGFDDIHNSAPHQSRFDELRGDGTILGLGRLISLDRIQGFDTADPHLSVYAEAVK